MHKKFHGLLLAGTACVAIGGDVAVSKAWAAVDEIIVTARFREESLQDVGGAVSAIAGSTIAREGIQDFEDIARRQPGLTLVDRGPDQNDVGLRGIANGATPRLADLGSAHPLVSQFLDDVPVAAATAAQRDFNYFDFERVEVLRGPQPTLFGEGSVGGTIRYFTKSPDLTGDTVNDSILRTSLSFTKDGGTNYAASAATSLVLIPEKLGIRGVLNYRNDDGYIDNPRLGLSDINDYEAVSGRAVILFKPTSELSIRLMGFVGQDDIGEANAVDALSAPDRLDFNSPVDGKSGDDFDLYSAKIDYDLGPIAVSSITGWLKREREDSFFDSQSSVGFGALLPVVLNAVGESESSDEGFSQEFRFVSDFAGPLNFIAGLYYKSASYDTHLLTSAPELAAFSVSGTQTLLIDQGNTVESEQYSGFLELTLEVEENLRLIAGARYLSEEIENTSTSSKVARGTGGTAITPPFVVFDVNALAGTLGLPLKEKFKLDKVLPRFSVEYDLNDDAMLYGIVANGIRNGNLNPFTSAFQGSGGNPAIFERLRSFHEDKVWSFEIGAKTEWLGGNLIVNGDVFYTTFEDPQILTANPLVLTANGPDERIVGVELETVWKASDVFDFYANGTYQDAEFTSDAVLGSAATLSGLGFTHDLDKGNRPVNAPVWSFSLGANMDYPLANSGISLVGFAGYQFVDSRFMTSQNFPSSEVGEQNFVNLRLGLKGDWWSLIGFVDNATNEVEFQSLQGGTSMVHLDANGDLDFTPSGAAINRPRTVGLELTLHY
ncbi:MAG: TonB-dependent receptor [Alphaproteobacteria bacterium]|nr:TonB-dependent receptor [Alphaproteobacteria bacterium]